MTRPSLLPTTFATLLLTLCFGCQDAEKPTITLTQQQWKEVKKNILTKAPTPKYKVGANFGDKLELIGFDVTEPIVAGKEVTFTWYWKAKAKMTKNWRIFIHFDSQANPVRQGLDHHPVNELYQTTRWEPGQIIKDVQKITMRPDYPQGTAIPYVGLYHEAGDGARLPIINDVPKTEDQRAITATLQVINKNKPVKKAPLVLPTHSVSNLEDQNLINVDGKLDEATWKSAKPLILKPFGGGQAYPTVAKIAWDNEALYIGATLSDEHIWGTLKDRDSDTWTEEVFEVFIDTNGDAKDYVELQVTPKNVVFDANFKERLGTKDRQAMIDKARAWNMEGLQTAVGVDGTLDKADDKDKSWTVEMKLPFKSMPGAGAPPKAGATWSLNLYRFDRPAKDKTFAYAWSTAPRGDFHQVDKFGKLRFVTVDVPPTLKEAPPVPKGGKVKAPEVKKNN